MISGFRTTHVHADATQQQFLDRIGLLRASRVGIDKITSETAIALDGTCNATLDQASDIMWRRYMATLHDDDTQRCNTATLLGDVTGRQSFESTLYYQTSTSKDKHFSPRIQQLIQHLIPQQVIVWCG